VCAARTGIGDNVLAGLPELSIEGLGDSDARALLLRNVHGPLDAAVCEQIITESHGNPLALLELPRTWRAADLAGGFGLPGSRPIAGKIQQSYGHRLLLLPSETQLLVLAAAAEPLGDPVLIHRAAETLGIDMAAADAETDPDRRAWHRARATPGPDEDVAARTAESTRAHSSTRPTRCSSRPAWRRSPSARLELVATGEREPKRIVETREDLTAQEAQIARLARDGLSNPEIGARLFIGARTVEWHLRKVFAKLGITSRKQLRAALPASDRTLATV
jgi:DNA-binding CsgD family transcriptional regulator